MYFKNKSIHFSILISFLVVFINFFNANAQYSNQIKAEIEGQATGTTNGVVPFWMRSNQYGSVPLSGASASAIGRIKKGFYNSVDDSLNNHKFFWNFGLEGRVNGGNKINGQLIEADVKLRYAMFQLQGGRSKDVMGLNGDTTLSSGNFAISGNTLGVPKVELSIPNYWRIPIFDGLFSVKGTFSHGWLGKMPIVSTIASLDNKETYYMGNTNPITYFHQKSFYARLGKEDWSLQLYGGFNHQVFWGSEPETFGENFELTPFQTFWYVVQGKSYGNTGVPTSKIGNQNGSIDFGLEYDFESYRMLLYQQFFYDVGALSKLANAADGLTGIMVENKNFNNQTNSFKWKKYLVEFFHSKNQAGYPWSTPTKSGDEDYYNNFFYTHGWTYNDVSLGNPLITEHYNAKPGQARRSRDFFINNRVLAFHFGANFEWKIIDFITKLSLSKNFGTFATSEYGSSTGVIRNPETSNLFVPVYQSSFYLKASKKLPRDLAVGAALAFDAGSLLNDSFGLNFSVKRTF
ncbi:capsule assembly Wzi family protein [Pedobacter sp. MW01-1-1]|uniref:capsule assembly Wzi family protein n=1 Tax=Pedobacter sp. MW01-1-1 TaxID=3383027 RepID=UPI003FED9B65